MMKSDNENLSNEQINEKVITFFKNPIQSNVPSFLSGCDALRQSVLTSLDMMSETGGDMTVEVIVDKIKKLDLQLDFKLIDIKKVQEKITELINECYQRTQSKKYLRELNKYIGRISILSNLNQYLNEIKPINFKECFVTFMQNPADDQVFQDFLLACDKFGKSAMKAYNDEKDIDSKEVVTEIKDYFLELNLTFSGIDLNKVQEQLTKIKKSLEIKLSHTDDNNFVNQYKRQIAVIDQFANVTNEAFSSRIQSYKN